MDRNVDVPFLLKILSVRKALSIQAHPDAELAPRLHSEFPEIYKDPNHKPEIMIAITEFEALCGFRPVKEIVNLVDLVPELSSLFETKVIAGLKSCQKEGLKLFFKALMTCQKEKVLKAISDLKQRLSKVPPSELEKLCLRLDEQFPEEVGCFCVFVLNYTRLKPGESLFLAANEPHAYLSGECVECMALSDNVVRAGLTPKFRDIETLCNMLTYKTFSREDLLLKPTRIPETKFSQLYAPPVREFAVIEIKLDKDSSEMVYPKKGPSILICIDGETDLESKGLRMQIQKGSVLLVPSDLEFTLQTSSDRATLYLAFTPQ